jgi:hypothetical protein
MAKTTRMESGGGNKKADRVKTRSAMMLRFYLNQDVYLIDGAEWII